MESSAETHPVRGRVGVEPGRDEAVRVAAVHGAPQGIDVRQRLKAERPGRLRMTHDDLVAEALDQGPGDRSRHGRDQVHPVRGESGRQHGHGDHEPPEAAQARVHPHHVAVGEHVRAADLDDAGHLRMVEGADEIREHVTDPDRLAPGGNPAGRDHDRQPLRQVAQDLERCASGPDDDCGPELRDRHPAGAELGARLVAAGQVVGEVRRVVAQAPEIDDPLDSCVSRSLREVARRLPVARGEAVLAGTHRVREVVRHVHALDRTGQGGGVEEVGGYDAGAGEPVGKRAFVAAHEYQLVRARLEQRDQASADVAAGADDQDAHGRSIRRVARGG